MNKKPAPKTGELLEQTLNHISLIPMTEADNASSSRRISAIGITADVLNRNGRMYPASVLSAAVLDVQQRLAQGEYLFGERDHPRDRDGASLESTCVNWDKISFDGKQVLLEGVIIQNETGNDILAFFAEGIMPCVSQRGYGASDYVKQGDGYVEQIMSLKILGYDLVVFPSDAVAGVTKVESEELSKMNGTQNPTDITPPLTVDDFKKQYGDVVAQLLHEEQQKREAESQVQAQAQAKIQAEKDELERKLREAAGVPESANLQDALKAQASKMKEIQEAELKAKINTAIQEGADKLKYTPEMRGQYMESVKRLAPKTLDEAQHFMAAMQIEYDARAAAADLKAQGYKKSPTAATAPVIHGQDVLESELGIPSYLGVAHLLMEAEAKRYGRKPFSLSKPPANRNQAYTQKVLRLYAEKYQNQLVSEQRQWDEAVQTASLSMPYQWNYKVLQQALPDLVAATVFNLDTMPGPSMVLLVERYEGEEETYPTVVDEAVVAAHGSYVKLNGARLEDNVTVTNVANDVIYQEGSHYIIDYVDGYLKALASGTIPNGATLHVSYKYSNVRKGELDPIEEAGIVFDPVTITSGPDSLATKISNDVIAISKADLNYDVVGAVITSLSKKLAAHIDKGIFNTALSAVRSVENNSGGEWNKLTMTLNQLVEFIGNAEVKVKKRYYNPETIVVSTQNGKLLSRWEGFTSAGNRPGDALTMAGELGDLGGRPVVTTTELSDSYILVVDRNLVYHRVELPMQLDGPHQSYGANGTKMIRAKQFYMEERNATAAPIRKNGSYVKLV